MNFVKTLMGGGVATAAEAVGTALDGLITSDEERGRLEIERLKVSLLPVMAAWEERRALAQHKSLFVAGARPAMLWVVTLGLAYVWLLQPVLSGFHAGFVMPDADAVDMMEGLAFALYGVRGVEGVFGRKSNTL